MKHNGACHCGNITVCFDSAADPAKIEIRACQCSFCRKHNTRAIADPYGMLTIKVADQDKLSRYQFGLRTAEYLICRDCGVYVAACTLDKNNRRAILIVSVLDNRNEFSRKPVAMSYDAEQHAQRLKRRNESWMPVRVDI